MRYFSYLLAFLAGTALSFEGGIYSEKQQGNWKLVFTTSLWSPKKEGRDPVFDPEKLGIKNAHFWEKEYQVIKNDEEGSKVKEVL